VSWLRDFLVQLLGTDTQVPLGQTEIAAGDPKIVAAVDAVLMPHLDAMQPDEVRRHDQGDVALRFGPERDDGLLIQTYIVSQHANLMEGEAGSLVDGGDFGLEGKAVLGQGASQNKGPLAAAFAAVRGRPRDLRRPVWLAVNTEGRSSHGGSTRLLDDLGVTAVQGIVAFGTDLRVSLGNRGRVDVEVLVKGASSHSSQPWLGKNPIEGAADVVTALRTTPLPPPDADLGPASATPYQFACYPIAPHTIPEDVRIVVDRRLLPGETPDAAVDVLREHLASIEGVDVETGVWMFPAAVAADSPVVAALLEGTRRAGRNEPETFWSLNAFDAGYACSKGIPTPMYGPGKRSFAGAGLVGSDAVALDDCEVAARAYAYAIETLCAS
jgi:acetylornithine deacetylase